MNKNCKITLRESTPADFEFVFNLNKTNMRPYVEKIRGWNEVHEREDMKTKFTPGVDKIIQVEGEDMGVYSVKDKGDYVLLDHVELLPSHQGKGIGTMLIKKLLSKGNEVRLQVLKINPAVELYKKLGFEIVEETELKYKMSFRPRG